MGERKVRRKGQELIGVSFYRIALLLASQALSTRRMLVGRILTKSATVEEVYQINVKSNFPFWDQRESPLIKNELARQWFGRNCTVWFMYLVTTPGILACRQFLYYIVWTLIFFTTPLKLALAQIQPRSWIIVVTRVEYFIKPTTGRRAFQSYAIIKLLQETIHFL